MVFLFNEHLQLKDYIVILTFEKSAILVYHYVLRSFKYVFAHFVKILDVCACLCLAFGIYFTFTLSPMQSFVVFTITPVCLCVCVYQRAQVAARQQIHNHFTTRIDVYLNLMLIT